MHANGKRVKVEMGTHDGRGDNTKPWFGHIFSSCGVTKKYVTWVEGSWPKSKRTIDKRYVSLDTSSTAKALEPRSRGKASEADMNRIKKKLDMEGDVTVRKLEDEIKKLKKARIRDKALSAKNLKNKLQEQERTFTSDFLRAREVWKRAEEGYKVAEAKYEKEVARCNRFIESLSHKVGGNKQLSLQTSTEFEWLRSEHETAMLDLTVLKKEHAALQKDLKNVRASASAMKERHRDKVNKLTTEMQEWRDSYLPQFVSTKVHQGLTSPFTPDFEHCSRGMLATGIAASTCVDTWTRCRDFFLRGKAREHAVIPKKYWFTKTEGVCWVCSVRACRACDCQRPV